MVINTEIKAKNYEEAVKKAKQQEKTQIIFSSKNFKKSIYKLEMVCSIK